MKLSTEEIRHSHYLAGLPADMDCKDHSILFHALEEEMKEMEAGLDPAISEEKFQAMRRNAVLEDMTDHERIEQLEQRLLRMKRFVNEIVAELNATQDRVAVLEQKLKLAGVC